jgi:LysR family hydrogen peroxide-inducible transcriptional activator
MTLVQLEYVIALYEERNFSRAAERCNVTQPNLSMQIDRLEKEFGVKLFDRRRQSVEITTTGSVLVEKARNILREKNSFRDYLKSQQNDMSGTYRIGIIPTLAPYLVPLFLPQFRKAYPDTRLVIEELITEDIVSMLKEDKLDIGIAVTPLEERLLREVPVFNEPIFAYVSQDHPLFTLKTVKESDLAKHRIWLLNQGHCFRNQVLNICDQTNQKKEEAGFVYESGSLETLKNLVSLGDGLTLLPALAAYNNVENLDMIKRFSDPQPLREVSLVVHEHSTRNKLIESLYSTIVDKVPEEYQVKYKNGRIIHWV